MKKIKLNATEQSVLNEVKKQPLTSFEILNKVENVTMILSLYTILDDLKSKGVVKTFTKENKKYHIAC